MATKKRKKGQKTRTRAGSSTKYGSRYGGKHRHKIAKLNETKRHQPCPQCGRKSLNRKGFKWVCTKCGAVLVGGMYVPQTALGKIINKIFGKKLTKAEIKEITGVEEEIPEEEKPKKVEKPKEEPKKEVKEEIKEEEKVEEKSAEEPPKEEEIKEEPVKEEVSEEKIKEEKEPIKKASKAEEKKEETKPIEEKKEEKTE